MADATSCARRTARITSPSPLSRRPPMPLPAGPALLYVRLATVDPQARRASPNARRFASGSPAAASIHACCRARGIAVGEMPVIGRRRHGARAAQPASTGSNDLRADGARTRARATEAGGARQAAPRGARRQGRSRRATLLPFEDFDLASRSVRGDGTRVITPRVHGGTRRLRPVRGVGRSGGAEAGDDGSGAATIAAPAAGRPLQALDHRAASSSPTTSASAPTPYPPTEQAAHPVFDWTDGDRAGARRRLHARRASRRRVPGHQRRGRPRPASPMSPSASASSASTGERETAGRVAQPAVLQRDDACRADFDLRLGHPIFAAVSAPLATLGRGDYRLKITVNDRVRRHGRRRPTPTSRVDRHAAVAARAKRRRSARAVQPRRGARAGGVAAGCSTR